VGRRGGCVSEQQRNPDELGALWIKSGAKGEYMTGTINGQAVVVFRNDRKQGNQPDWRVLKSRTRDERAAQADPDDF
jgi:uncharacterized protein (DUF736 family)